MRWLIWLMFAAVVANAESERAVLPNGLVCYRTASMFLFRDSSSACGKTTTFCTVPLSCYVASTMQYVGGSVATCRANHNTSQLSSSTWSDAGLYCPSVQECIDDERQEFVTEGEKFAEAPSTSTPKSEGYDYWVPTHGSQQ